MNYFTFTDTDPDQNELASSTARKWEYQSTRIWCAHVVRRWDNCGVGMAGASSASCLPSPPLGPRTPLHRPTEVTTWTPVSLPRSPLVRRIEERRAAGLTRTPRLSPCPLHITGKTIELRWHWRWQPALTLTLTARVYYQRARYQCYDLFSRLFH